MALIVGVKMTRELVGAGLADLEIGPGMTGGLQLEGDGLLRPDIRARRTYAPDSPDHHGSELLAVALEQGNLPLPVLAKASTQDELDLLLDTVEAAVAQFTYTTKVLTGGRWKHYSSDPADVTYTANKARAHARYQSFVLNVPIYPIATVPTP